MIAELFVYQQKTIIPARKKQHEYGIVNYKNNVSLVLFYKRNVLIFNYGYKLFLLANI